MIENAIDRLKKQAHMHQMKVLMHMSLFMALCAL